MYKKLFVALFIMTAVIAVFAADNDPLKEFAAIADSFQKLHKGFVDSASSFGKALSVGANGAPAGADAPAADAPAADAPKE